LANIRHDWRNCACKNQEWRPCSLCFLTAKALCTKFVEEGCTVNAEYHKGVLNRLILCIWWICPALYCACDCFSCTTMPWLIRQQWFDSFQRKNKSWWCSTSHTHQIWLPWTISSSRRWSCS
jgi:hypothetical protein